MRLLVGLLAFAFGTASASAWEYRVHVSPVDENVTLSISLKSLDPSSGVPGSVGGATAGAVGKKLLEMVCNNADTADLPLMQMAYHRRMAVAAPSDHLTM